MDTLSGMMGDQSFTNVTMKFLNKLMRTCLEILILIVKILVSYFALDTLPFQQMNEKMNQESLVNSLQNHALKVACVLGLGLG